MNNRVLQKGSVFVLFAFALFLLFGVLALVIDVGYRTVQKNNLQNAVDAAALRGASYIYEDGLLGITFLPSSSTATNAYTNAYNYFATNVPAINLTSLTVTVNWWDQFNPVGPFTYPAVKVVASTRPIQFFGFLGANTTNIQTQAIAIVPYPSSVKLRTGPLGVADCAVKDGWDSTLQQPKVISAGNFVSGVSYVIQTLGSTNFQSIGAGSNPSVGTVFTATGAGSGSGTANLVFTVSTTPQPQGSCSVGSTSAWTPLCSINNVAPYFGQTSPNYDGTQYACSAATNNGGSAGAGLQPLVPVPSSYGGMQSTLALGQSISFTQGNLTGVFSSIKTCAAYCPGGLTSGCTFQQRAYSCQYSSFPIVQTVGGNGTTTNPGTGIATSGTNDYKIIGFACVQILSVKDTGSPKTVTAAFSKGNCAPSAGSGGGKYNGVLLPPKLAN
jgi:hypothetical protein